MSDLTTDFANTKLSGVLASLDEAELTPEEASKALQDQIEKFSKPAFEYELEIDFDNTSEIQKDMIIARQAIMDALDKASKLSGIVFEALVVDPTNPLLLQMASNTTSTIQSTVKTLSDVHNSYHKIVGQKKRNDILDNVDPKTPSNNPDDEKFQFGSGHKLVEGN